MKTMTATCTGHSFPASTIIQWAPNAQRWSGRRVIHVCALIDMRILSHFTSANAWTSRLRRCRLLGLLPAGRFPLHSFALASTFIVYTPRPSRTLCAARTGPSPPCNLPTLPS
ncbi:hypothetical protein B0H14DRAFT_3896139 [Mycena olivaceomarginata]|nr:hypothetical protein B0H14DRAFT_3896139 [Mycena olivaceomarginata]